MRKKKTDNKKCSHPGVRVCTCTCAFGVRRKLVTCEAKLGGVDRGEPLTTYLSCTKGRGGGMGFAGSDQSEELPGKSISSADAVL